jgi:transposase
MLLPRDRRSSLVAALGYSNAIFAHAYADQTALSWLDSQHRAFVAFSGVPRLRAPDNPKALIAKAALRTAPDDGIGRFCAPLRHHNYPGAEAQTEGQSGRSKGWAARRQGGSPCLPWPSQT